LKHAQVAVQPLDVVDNSTSPLRTHFGLGFSSIDATDRVLHSVDPGTCHCFHLHQAAHCHFTGRLLTLFTLT
jgi:hypothetical protein